MVKAKTKKKVMKAAKRITFVPNRVQWLIVTALVLLLVVFGLFVGWLDTQVAEHYARRNDARSTQVFGDVTIRGESTCLRHKDDGPNTAECAIGIKTPSGDYAVVGELSPSIGNPVEATGTLAAPGRDEAYEIQGRLTIKP
jgi:hypothetical protein